MAVLLIDNYDSFTHNLYQAVRTLGPEVVVVRNDAITLLEVELMAPSHVIISPGPGHPARARDFGICSEVITHLRATTPILGVCLGFQGMAHLYGGQIVRAPEIVHGKTSVITHDGQGVFRGLPPSVEVMRYHSLMLDPATVPGAFVVSSQTETGVIMGIRHRELPLEGVQFHPESIGTPDGPAMLRNFLEAP